MKTFKAGLRLLVMVLLLIMAAFGLGFGNVLNPNRERFMDNEIRIEQEYKREEDEEHDERKA